ncbi:MAG: hypothetical protein KAX44_06155 [Candidatus Brocadiae bacterium]|nr:hypothetical protein [Candidatus Brocadiia bacterium]
MDALWPPGLFEGSVVLTGAVVLWELLVLWCVAAGKSWLPEEEAPKGRLWPYWILLVVVAHVAGTAAAASPILAGTAERAFAVQSDVLKKLQEFGITMSLWFMVPAFGWVTVQYMEFVPLLGMWPKRWLRIRTAKQVRRAKRVLLWWLAVTTLMHCGSMVYLHVLHG